MNKKILLGTLVTSGVLTTSLLAPFSMAATIKGEGKELTGNISNNTVSVVLPSTNERNANSNSLTRENLVKIVEEKYKSNVVKSVKDVNGNEITDNNAKVGTGSVVTLNTDKEVKVVLYGDVNGNGVVDTLDTLAIANHNVGSNALSGVYFTAGELTGSKADEKLNAMDALRVAYYNVNKVGQGDSYGKTIVDEALYPSDEVVITDELVQNAIDGVDNSDLYSFKFDKETNEVTCEFLTADSKISDLVGSGTGFITKLVEQLKNSNVNDIKISFDGKEVTLKAGATSKDILKAAKELLGNDFDIPVVNLAGKELKASVNFKDSNFVVENGSIFGSNSIDYTLKFKADTKTVIENTFDKFNESGVVEVGFADNNSNEVNFAIKEETKEQTIKETFENNNELKEEVLGLVSDLQGDKYKDVKANLKSVTFKLDDKEYTLTSGKNGKLEEVNKVAKDLFGCEIVKTENGGFDLKFDENKKMEDLVSKKLDIDFDFKDGVNMDDLKAKYGDFDFEKGLQLLFK